MHAQDGVKGSELKPANKQFSIGWIVGVANDESTNVRGPVGNTGKSEVQTGRNLAAIAEPVGIDVTRPGRDGVSLRACKGGSRQDKYALLVGSAALAVVNRNGRQHGVEIDVGVAPTRRPCGT